MVAIQNEQDNAMTPQLLEESIRESEAIHDVSTKVRRLIFAVRHADSLVYEPYTVQGDIDRGECAPPGLSL